jgi:hypothetical protein
MNIELLEDFVSNFNTYKNIYCFLCELRNFECLYVYVGDNVIYLERSCPIVNQYYNNIILTIEELLEYYESLLENALLDGNMI